MVMSRYIFNLACFATAFAMSALWLYRFLLDEDDVQFNIKPFDFEEGEYPILSFCFEDHLSNPNLGNTPRK